MRNRSPRLHFLINYEGLNEPLLWLQMRSMMMHVNIIHCSAKSFGGADYGSREVGDLWDDPLIVSYNTFLATLRKKYTAPFGPILP